VELDGRPLVDGALVNPVPVSVCRAMGPRLVIAVNLNADMLGSERAQSGGGRNYGGRNGGGQNDQGRENGGMMGGAGLLESLFRRDGNPSIFIVMASALNILQDHLSRSRLAGDPPDVTIAPKVGHIGLLDFDQAEDLIELGAQAAQSTLPSLNEALTILRA